MSHLILVISGTNREFSDWSVVTDVSIVHINIRSLNANFDELEYIVGSLEQKPLIIGLTETWLHQNSPVNAFSLEGYHSLITRNRANKGGGGVAAYIRNDIPFKVINNDFLLETLVLDFFLHRRKHRLNFVYAPPSMRKSDF